MEETRWSTLAPTGHETEAVNATAAAANDTAASDSVTTINFVAHGIVANIIVGVGIIGNILNLIVLTRPKLKGVMYVYLLGLAVSNLCVLLTAIPALMSIVGTMGNEHGYASAFFHAYLEIPLLNSFMASSVYIIICMTVNRYISIYKPTHFQRIHTFKNAYIAIVFSFICGCILHVPLAFSKSIDEVCENRTELEQRRPEERRCTYVVASNEKIENSGLFEVYRYISEALLRFGPIITLTILNILIIVRFHTIARKREVLKSGTHSQHRGSTASGMGGMPQHAATPSPFAPAAHHHQHHHGAIGGGNGISHGRLSFSEVNGKLAPLPSTITMSTTVSSSGSSSNGTASTHTTSGATVSIADDRTTCNFHSDVLLADPTSTMNGNGAGGGNPAQGSQVVISRAHTPLPSSAYPSSSPSKFPILRGTPQRQSSRRRGLHNPEERMLVVVLIAIVILFVVCTTPAAVLSILVTEEIKKQFWFAIFRACANNLELLCFALNFFVYCLCSADIRRAFVDVLFENSLVLYIRTRGFKPSNVELATVANYPENV